jgi:hypothetical protein
MKIESQWKTLLRLAPLIGIIDLALALIVVVVGLVLGWKEPGDYSAALKLAGVAAWGIAGLSVMGTVTFGDNFKGTFARNATPNIMNQIGRQAKDRPVSDSFLMLMFAVGVVLIALGLLLTAL